MVKKLFCLLAALVLTFALATTAFAENTMNILTASVLDGGYLGVLIGTDYTSEEDMNFSAKTENGPIQIADARILRNEGTSWFVILDYNNYNSDTYNACVKQVLKRIGEMVSDQDDGVLVKVSKDPHTLVPEHAANLRDSLSKGMNGYTDANGLATTVKEVYQYIQDNRGSLMPNVAVIIVSPTPSKKVTNEMIEEIGNVMGANQGITTHIIITAARDNYQADREAGQKLAEKAKLTIGGTSYVTSKWKDDEADKGVQRIADAERRKIYMLLYPEYVQYLGKKLTLTQITAGGKELVQEWEIPDFLVEWWTEKKEEGGQTEGEPGTQDPTDPENPNGWLSQLQLASTANTYYDTTQPYVFNDEPAGLPTEALIGIIAGGVLLILLAVLLIVRLSKNKKAPQSTYVAAAATGSTSTGTTIILAGQNGTTLKGTMRNNTLTIGRNGAKAMLDVPNDGKLSGLHATFTKQGNTMTVTDNGSTNGTKLNGTKLAAGKPVQIQQNDTLTLGSTTYTISWRG